MATDKERLLDLIQAKRDDLASAERAYREEVRTINETYCSMATKVVDRMRSAGEAVPSELCYGLGVTTEQQ